MTLWQMLALPAFYSPRQALLIDLLLPLIGIAHVLWLSLLPASAPCLPLLLQPLNHAHIPMQLSNNTRTTYILFALPSPILHSLSASYWHCVCVITGSPSLCGIPIPFGGHGDLFSATSHRLPNLGVHSSKLRASPIGLGLPGGHPLNKPLWQGRGRPLIT
jgi:hypothetical protein